MNQTLCPCSKCRGAALVPLKEVFAHLIKDGRDPTMRVWRGPGDVDFSDEEWEAADAGPMNTTRPGKMDVGIQIRPMLQHKYQNVDDVLEVENQLNDIVMESLDTADKLLHTSDCGEGQSKFPPCDDGACGHEPDSVTGGAEARSDNSNGSEEVSAAALEDAVRSLYPGSASTKLAATIMITNLCAVHSVTNKMADDMLALFKHLLPPSNTLPASMYHAKALTTRLGLDFKNIHCCPASCVLFRGEYEDLLKCPECDRPRYKDMTNKIGPMKVLRHFPLIPRLQRLFRTPALSKLMRWHKANESKDGLVRFPADCRAWKHLDQMPDTNGFGQDERHVRLQISADGICPFKLHKSTWSC